MDLLDVCDPPRTSERNYSFAAESRAELRKSPRREGTDLARRFSEEI
jgi:hypothetical protein